MGDGDEEKWGPNRLTYVTRKPLDVEDEKSDTETVYYNMCCVIRERILLL